MLMLTGAPFPSPVPSNAMRKGKADEDVNSVKTKPLVESSPN